MAIVALIGILMPFVLVLALRARHESSPRMLKLKQEVEQLARYAAALKRKN